ncbi:MAG: dTMP kinase [Actinomycetota bacterium]|jgi:dTMP kinase|nr:dTMP kinase [Actinomycetota bacterium]
MTFIVVEGGEGVGKSTQVDLLVERLQATGRVVDKTREPGGTKRGAELRERLLHDPRGVDPDEELELLLEDRRIHLEERIAPDLAQRIVVVCDRFTPSTLAYQGLARGLGLEKVEAKIRQITGTIEPDVVVVLDLPDDVAEARITGDRDRFERAGADFHARVRAAYRELAPDRGWVVVDASGSPAEVADRVWAAVEPHL